jgi:hypothetical protein
MKLVVLSDPVEHTVRLPTLAKNIQDAFRDLKVYRTPEHRKHTLGALQEMERQVLALYQLLEGN